MFWRQSRKYYVIRRILLGLSPVLTKLGAVYYNRCLRRRTSFLASSKATYYLFVADQTHLSARLLRDEEDKDGDQFINQLFGRTYYSIFLLSIMAMNFARLLNFYLSLKVIVNDYRFLCSSSNFKFSLSGEHDFSHRFSQVLSFPIILLPAHWQVKTVQCVLMSTAFSLSSMFISSSFGLFPLLFEKSYFCIKSY